MLDLNDESGIRAIVLKVGSTDVSVSCTFADGTVMDAPVPAPHFETDVRLPPELEEPPRFEDHVPRYYREMTTFARNLARDAQTADDVVQQSMLRALRSWKTFVPSPGVSMRSAVRGWLYTIVRRVFIDGWHVRRRRLEVGGDALDGDFVGEDPRDTLGDVAGDEVYDAIARLPTCHRQAIECAYLRGMGYAEIAAELGIDRMTVGSRLTRGRALLRKMLHDYAGNNGYDVEDS